MKPRVPSSGFRVPGCAGDPSCLEASRQLGTQNPEPGTEPKGSVLILAMVLVAVLALLATAFILVARVESRAATNSLRGMQAEAACQAGVAAAIYQIGETCSTCYSLDSATGWHGYFRDTAAGAPNLCPDTWVQHYDATQAGHEMTAKKVSLPRVAAGDTSSGTVKKLKRVRGFASEYFVAVADLDGKLHSNPWHIDNLLDDTAPEHQTQDMLDSLLLPVVVRDAMVNDLTPHYSLGELRATLLVAGFNDDGLTDKNELNLGEDFFTIYPRVAALAVKGDAGRPAVNVNTARRVVLEAIVLNVPGLDGGTLASDVAQKLVDKRPFASRKDMEAAIDDLAPAPLGDDTLTEQQFNDLLNSLAGANAAGESDYDLPASPGVYEYDISASSTSGGARTMVGVGPVSADYTWGTEVKFHSRFFHIYVMGRAVADDTKQRTLSERRVHAVYDAATRKVLWQRWHFYPKSNMAD